MSLGRLWRLFLIRYIWFNWKAAGDYRSVRKLIILIRRNSLAPTAYKKASWIFVGRMKQASTDRAEAPDYLVGRMGRKSTDANRRLGRSSGRVAWIKSLYE